MYWVFHDLINFLRYFVYDGFNASVLTEYVQSNSLWISLNYWIYTGSDVRRTTLYNQLEKDFASIQNSAFWLVAERIWHTSEPVWIEHM